MRRSVARPSRTEASPPLIAVSYDRSTATRSAASIASREIAAGATLTRSLDFPYAGITMHVLSVPAGKMSTTMAALRTQTGVKSVAATGYRRHALGVTTPYWPNDPYFNGFTEPQIVSAGVVGQAATYHVPPYEEGMAAPGQWDMHETGLEYAFGYSQTGNGSGIVNAEALGSPSVIIAMIDTGQDATHPELTGKFARQGCFISAATAPYTQSTSSFTTDPDGHGTDTAGIAAENTGNNFGFTGAGGNVRMFGYRIFPTPDDSCATEDSSDDQCSASTTDIASAMNDAVANGANVISLSLGGGMCNSGVDDDMVEQAAVTNALNHNVIVVAAAGNDSQQILEAPGCDSGVIAAGATSLDDGQPNGSSHTGGSSTTPVVYVASYSNWGMPAASVHSTAAWGIVAPGGDPNGDTDNDDLHWIENIWTSAPYMMTSTDTNFEGECDNDFPNSALTTNPDCRTLIAGTSMATPHVAGAVALILSVNAATYGTPAAMKTLLCQTADDISDPHEGCGSLNVYRAMATALNDPHPP